MFGRRTDTRRTRSGGVFGGSNLRKAAIAGVGMLALQWWRNRQATNRPGGSREPDLRDDVVQPS
jgi:hypothetical protein